MPYSGPFLITTMPIDRARTISDTRRELQREVLNITTLNGAILNVVDEEPDDAESIEVWVKIPAISVKKSVQIIGLDEYLKSPRD